MKWNMYVYNPKTERTTTHVLDYPNTSKGDGRAVTAWASRDLKKHMKYILAIPHSGT